jgi:type I restriction enzyme S subunit
MTQADSLKTGQKFKKTEIGAIPVDWEILTLGEITEEVYRYPTYYNIEYVIEGIPEVRGELIMSNGSLEPDLAKYRYISPKTAANFPRTCLREGDLVMSVRGTMGKIAIISKSLEGANMTANLIRISPNKNRVFPLFLQQTMISDKFQALLDIASSSTTIKTIKAPELKYMKFAVPPLSEQKKIAEILITLDEAISKSDEIIEKTKELKKGLMQQLLTRGIGHTKFKKTKIGEIPMDWEVMKLQDIVVEKRGSIKRGPFGGSIKKSYFVSNGYKIYEQKNVIYEDFELGDYYIDADKFNELQDFEIKSNDLLISCSGTIGKIVIVPCNISKGIINQALLRITLNFNRITPVFFKYLIETEHMQKKIIAHTHGSAMKNIVSIKELKKILLGVPSLDEQQKIVRILFDIDTEINHLMTNKEKLKTLKKGLMQVLLTGKVRVRV